MAEVGEFGGPSFGGPGALGGGPSEEEKELSNAIARNILGISTSTYGAPLDSPEAANYGFGLGSNLASISPNLPQYAQPFLNPSTGLAQMEPGFFDFSGPAGALKAAELGLGVPLGQLGATQVSNEAVKEALRAKGIDPDDVGYFDSTINLNFPSIIGKKMSPVAYGNKKQQQEVIESLYDTKQISLPTAITYGGLVNHMNPNLGQLNVNPENLDIESYIEGVLDELGSMSTNVTFDDNSPYTNPYAGPQTPGILDSILDFIGPFGNTPSNPNYQEPSIELQNPVDITPSTNPGAKAILDAFGIENQTPTNQQEVDALMDDVLGQQSIFDGISVDPLDLSMAMASVEDNPWGYNQSVIDALNTSFDTGALSGAGGDPRLAEAKRLAEQRAAEAMIARQARQARQVTPVEQRNPSDKVTIPVSSGPDIVIDVTPPPPAPKLTGKQAANEPRNPSDAPIRIAAKSIARPKAFKALPKFAQKEIRQGKVPTGGSDYMQDMIREFLNPRDSSYRKSKPVYARMDDR